MKKLKVYTPYQTFLGTSFTYCLRGVGKGLTEITTTKKHMKMGGQKEHFYFMRTSETLPQIRTMNLTRPNGLNHLLVIVFIEKLSFKPPGFFEHISVLFQQPRKKILGTQS